MSKFLVKWRPHPPHVMVGRSVGRSSNNSSKKKLFLYTFSTTTSKADDDPTADALSSLSLSRLDAMKEEEERKRRGEERIYVYTSVNKYILKLSVCVSLCFVWGV